MEFGGKRVPGCCWQRVGDPAGDVLVLRRKPGDYWRKTEPMDLDTVPLFRAMTRKMSWLGQRQQVLAQNVANADTPGFVPQDLKKQSFRDLVQGSTASSKVQLVTTSPMHVNGSATQTVAGAQKERKLVRTVAGNGVNIEKEMMKVSDTASDYTLMTNLYRRHVGMLKSALGRNGG